MICQSLFSQKTKRKIFYNVKPLLLWLVQNKLSLFILKSDDDDDGDDDDMVFNIIEVTLRWWRDYEGLSAMKCLSRKLNSVSGRIWTQDGRERRLPSYAYALS